MLREVAETGLTHGPEALAKEFALISRALAAEDFRLYRLHRYERVPVAIMDGSFPGFSTRTSALALALPKDIAETLTASMRVMWWASGQSPLSLTMCAAEWAVRISTAWPDPGIIKIAPIGEVVAAFGSWPGVVRDFVGGKPCRRRTFLSQLE